VVLLLPGTPWRFGPHSREVIDRDFKHVQSASGKFLVRPVIVLTAICFPVGVQVEAAQSAKYPWQNRKSGVASAAPPGRAVGGANTRSIAVRPNTTFENVFPLTARRDLCISVSPH
jgi:hypothetical protein